MLHQEGLVLGTLALGGLRLAGFGALEFGQADRRRGVAQEEYQSDRPGESDGRGDPEAPFPGPDMIGPAAARPHDIAAEDHHQTGSDRVRGVPHRHLGGQLAGRDPVGQQPGAGRESRTLQQAVHHPHDPHEEDHCIGEPVARMLARDPAGDILAESEGEVGQRTECQSDGHVPAGVHAIGQNAVHKTRKSVDHAVECQKDAQADLRDAEIGLQAGHRQREILAHEIEERIADHRGQDRAHLPMLETLVLFGCHLSVICP